MAYFNPKQVEQAGNLLVKLFGDLYDSDTIKNTDDVLLAQSYGADSPENVVAAYKDAMSDMYDDALRNMNEYPPEYPGDVYGEQYSTLSPLAYALSGETTHNPDIIRPSSDMTSLLNASIDPHQLESVIPDTQKISGAVLGRWYDKKRNGG